MTTSPSTSATSASDAPSQTRPPVVRRLAVAASVAVVTNVALALLLRAVTGTSGDFLPLQPGPVTVATLVGVLAGGLSYLLLRRLVRRPGRVFAVLVVVGVLLSLGGPLSLLGASPAEQPGVTDAAAMSLVLLHLVPAAAVLLAVRRRPGTAALDDGARR